MSQMKGTNQIGSMNIRGKDPGIIFLTITLPLNQDMRNRIDLRYLYVCSVDPPGCTDIDDALHCRELENGNLEVGVHIADVSHFIRPGNALDQEAANRGTTVYLCEKVKSVCSEGRFSLSEDDSWCFYNSMVRRKEETAADTDILLKEQGQFSIDL
ncbi:unnamed protein product [Ranitomeya imitator]|uniref:RNB domain-containing protein n=1 Tax=Ranitomeya imitator TaxID=111125 RepID=A0ABN9KUR0_9NEOB|nr:unnamed protein product [Ranitomeya imitator]